MPDRTYDIFSGSMDSRPLWLESVEGISAAITRMKQRAHLIPGAYFVMSLEDKTVHASINTLSLEGS